MNSLRIILVCAGLALMGGVVVAETPTTTKAIEFNVSAQPLGDALNRFAEQSGLRIVFYAQAARGIVSPPMAGAYTPEEALKILLVGSALQYRFVDRHTVEIHGADISAMPAQEQTRLAAQDDDQRSMQKVKSGEAQRSDSRTSDSSQIQDDSVEEIIVTAQKRVERLIDVPAPVTAIDAQPLATNNQLRLEDYYSKIPGLGLALVGNGSTPVVMIRGVFTGPDTNPTTGTVIDEVSYGSSVARSGAMIPPVDIDPGDLARIEVLRGPQGTLYGAASIGGLLKFVTVDPSPQEFSGQIQMGSTSVSHSDDLGYSLRGAVNMPLAETFALRFSAFTVRDPGYVDNLETGEDDVNSRKSDGARLSALWQSSENLSVKLSALVQSSEREGTQDVDTALGKDPSQRFLEDTGMYIRDSQAYSATVSARVGRVQLISATGYSIDESKDALDVSTAFGGLFSDLATALFPDTGADRAFVASQTEVDKFTQEIRATVPIGSKIDWLTGLFYTKERISTLANTQAATSAGANSAVGALFTQSFGPSIFEEYAVFSTVTLDVTDRWNVQVGGRFSDNRQTNRMVSSGALIGPDPSIVPVPNSDDTAFTYLLTPQFKVSPDMMMYFRLASGYRPGGANELCGAPGLPCSFGPDTTQNYDAGVKGSLLGGLLSYDVSVYYIDWKDLQVNQLIADDGFSTYTDNVSRARSQGLELTLESKPFRGTTLSAWMTYNDAEITEDFIAAGRAGSRGDRLPYGSRVSGSLSLDQKVPLWDTLATSIGASVRYVGDREGSFQDVGIERETYPSYVQMDLRATLAYEDWAFDAYVNNITDKRGVLRGGLDAAFLPSYFTYIQPRTIGISLGKSF